MTKARSTPAYAIEKIRQAVILSNNGGFIQLKVLFSTLALVALMLASQSLVAQSSSNRFSDGQIDEMNKAMRERAAAEAKAVPQDRPASQSKESNKESTKESSKTAPANISGAKKEIAEIDVRLISNSMGLESADDHQATVGEMAAQYGPDWATSKTAQAKIEKDALEKKKRLAKQKIQLQQRRAVLVDYLSTCNARAGGCKP